MAAALCPALRQVVVRAALSRARHHSALDPHLPTWHKFPATLYTIASASFQGVHKNNGMPGRRHKSEWHTRGYLRAFTPPELISFSLSLGTFLLYFMYLREPSDIDEYMNQPIWKQVPGIEPEDAERMMEVDKYLGLQVDYTELEKYKQEFYAQKLEDLHDEQQQRKKHQELLQAASSHRVMLENFSLDRPSK